MLKEVTMLLEIDDINNALERIVRNVDFIECESWSVDYTDRKAPIFVQSSGIFKGGMKFKMQFQISQEDLQTWALMKINKPKS